MSKREPGWLRKWKRKEKKAKENWKPYVDRNKILKEIGFTCYNDYLVSDLWKEIRDRRLSTQDVCSCCDNKADVVHHDTFYWKLLLGDEESVNEFCILCVIRVIILLSLMDKEKGVGVRQFECFDACCSNFDMVCQKDK